MLYKKGVLKNFTKFTRKHMHWSLFFNKVVGLRPATLLKKENRTQIFCCELCEIFQNTFFTEYLPVASYQQPRLQIRLHAFGWLTIMIMIIIIITIMIIIMIIIMMMIIINLFDLTFLALKRPFFKQENLQRLAFL